MSTMTRDAAETSVTFSLAELAQIEAERVREEDQKRARMRENEARARHEAEERRRAAETAQRAADAEARARREREAAAEKARIEAREQAAVTVARIEAEAKARLEADNAAREHELAVLRVREQSGYRRLQRALALVVGVFVCGGGAAAYGVSQHVAGLSRDAAELREGQQALARERDRAKTSELAALDRRHAALRDRPLARDAEEARATADAARGAINAGSLDHDRLRAFGDALDALEARIERLEKVAALDRRHADLSAWAAERRRSEVTAGAKVAAARAKGAADEGALRAYESALDEVRNALARNAGGTGRTQDGEPAGSPCNDPADPMCGFNGRSL